MKKIGKVTEYDGSIGKIVTDDNEYIFLEEDVIDTIKLYDYVVFRAENKGEIKKAFFIKKFDEKYRV